MNKSSSAVALILSFGLIGSFSAFVPVMAQQTTNATTTTTVPGPTGFPPLTTTAITNTTNATATQQPTAPAVTTTTTTTTNATGTGTLSARGLISSFILSTGQPAPPTPTNATGGGNATNATTPAPAPAESLLPYILGGEWNTNVNNGNVTSFDSNFTMVHTDGTDKHTHDITNFVSNPDSAPFQPNTNETALVIGKSNIGVDGSPKWNNVETTLILDKLSTLSIIVDSNATDNHFKNQPIYGIVTSPASQANTTAPAG
jgi:hypothetical protein